MESMAITENIPLGLLGRTQAYAALYFWNSIATLRVQHGDVRFPSERKIYGSKDLEFAARWKQLPQILGVDTKIISI